MPHEPGASGFIRSTGSQGFGDGAGFGVLMDLSGRDSYIAMPGRADGETVGPSDSSSGFFHDESGEAAAVDQAAPTAAASSGALTAWFNHYIPETVTIDQGGSLQFFNPDLYGGPFGGRAHTITELRSDGPPRFDGTALWGTAANIEGVAALSPGSLHVHLPDPPLHEGDAGRRLVRPRTPEHVGGGGSEPHIPDGQPDPLKQSRGRTGDGGGQAASRGQPSANREPAPSAPAGASERPDGDERRGRQRDVTDPGADAVQGVETAVQRCCRHADRGQAGSHRHHPRSPAHPPPEGNSEKGDGHTEDHEPGGHQGTGGSASSRQATDGVLDRRVARQSGATHHPGRHEGHRPDHATQGEQPSTDETGHREGRRKTRGGRR